MEEEIINSFLTFEVNGATYGIHVAHVVEIMAYVEPQSASASVPAMIGLVEHRGRVLPLIDSGIKFGSTPVKINEQTYMVIISVRNGDELFDVALAVDLVREVLEIPEANRLPIDSTYKPGYVLFAAQTPDGLGMFFDPDKVFTDVDIIKMADFTAKANKLGAEKQARQDSQTDDTKGPEA